MTRGEGMSEQAVGEVPATSLLIDAILEQENSGRVHIPSGRLSASQLANCAWTIWAERNHVPPLAPLTAKTLRRFAYGRLVEQFYRDAHEKAGTLLAKEVHVVDEGLGVSGYIDAVVGGQFQSLSFPVSTVYEIKSGTAKSLWWAVKNNEGAKESHKYQLGAYKLIYDRAGGWEGLGIDLPPVRAWVVLFASGDTGGELDYPLINKWRDAAEKRIDELNTYLSSDDPPPCECTALYNGKGPHYCKYAEWDEGQDRENPKVMPRTCCQREVD